jgi:PiT family inorganic phosphate transporter
VIKADKLIFKEPEPGNRPPTWIRAILIATCTLVSFFHGNNDGQKGIGLVLIILITFMPLQFALNSEFNSNNTLQALTKMDQIFEQERKTDLLIKSNKVKEKLAHYEALKVSPIATDKDKRTSIVELRVALTDINKKVKNELENPTFLDNKDNKSVLKTQLEVFKNDTEYSPQWVTLMIALSLGLGTMIGWKRIAITIGEKIGKKHMTYAEGATAELTAASTIGLSSAFGLPVSTTHVLSSGVAGAMTASKGIKNLQPATIKSIAIAWLLTLPVTITLAGGFYYLFRLFI